MEALVDGWSVVVVGSWNSAIFTPGWVIGRLTQSKQVSLAFPVGPSIFPPQLSFDGMHLRVSPIRLDLLPGATADASLLAGQETVTKILQELTHTPITAMGINFKFLEKEPTELLASVFRCADNDNMADAGCVVKQTAVSRTLAIEGLLLNLNLTQDANGWVTLDLNFHFDCAGAPAAIAALGVGVVDLKNRAMELLRKAYGIELPDGQGG